MTTADRWQTAQEYERGYWAQAADQIASGALPELSWYQWRADELVARLKRLGLNTFADGSARVVEVGCGPVGVAGCFPASARLAIDPLEDYYRANEVLAKLRNPAVAYRQGVGEQLPAEAAAYDLALIENCIDHVANVDGVMRELARVVRPGGLLYLTVNCRTWLGYGVHRVLSRTRLDPGHPHTFTPRRAAALVGRFGFEVLDQEVASYRESLWKDVRGPGLRERVKGLLGISEFLTSIVARRVAG